MRLSLSRSSRLYKFVFGHEVGKLEGFPEPRNERISLGLFAGLVIVTAFLKPFAFSILLLMDAMIKIICFLVDGSYARGSLLTKLEIIKIEPWPHIRGHRLSPWGLLAVAVIVYRYYYFGIEDAGEFLFSFVFMTLVFLSIKPGDKSPSMELAEAIGPKMDEKLRLAYYREPKLFPALVFID